MTTNERLPSSTGATVCFVSAILGALGALAAAGHLYMRVDFFGNRVINTAGPFWVACLLLLLVGLASLVAVVLARYVRLTRRADASIDDHAESAGMVFWTLTICWLVFIGASGATLIAVLSEFPPPLSLIGARAKSPVVNDAVPVDLTPDDAEAAAMRFALRPGSIEPKEGFEPFDLDGETIYIDPRPIVHAGDIQAIRGQFDNNSFEQQQAVISISLTQSAGAKVGRWTNANIGERLAIFVMGELHSAPRVNMAISRELWVSGNWSKEEIRDLVTRIRNGDDGPTD